MATMRAVQVASPNGPFQMVERALPAPRRREVRVKVQACGLCHSAVAAMPSHADALSRPPFRHLAAHRINDAGNVVAGHAQIFDLPLRTSSGNHL